MTLQPRRSIQRLKAYKPPLEGRIGKLRLDFNENVRGPSLKVLESLHKVTREQLASYPEYSAYYEKFSVYLDVDPEQIVFSNGTDEGIKLILDTYLSQGDEIIIPVPTFSMFEFYATRCGATITKVLFNDDLSFPTQRLIETLSDQTKIVVLVNPNNPTGTIIPKETIVKIVERRDDVLYIIDEAYYQFLGSSFLECLDKYNNVIILRTFSKVFGLANARIGIIISDTSVAKVLRKSSSPYAVSQLSCMLASAAIDDLEYIEGYAEEVISTRKYMIEKLQRRGWKCYHSGANFVLVDFGEVHDWIWRGLREHDILVRDRSSYPLLEGCIRITVGPKETIDHFLKILDKIMTTKLVIFDMDGVLVDVSRSYREVIKLTVEKFTGEMISNQDIQDLKNEGGYNNDWKVSHELIQRLGVSADFEVVKDEFQSLYLGDNENPGLINTEQWILNDEILINLRRSHPLAILTGRPRNEALHALKRANLLDFFDLLVTHDDIPDHGKPDPLGLQIIKEKLRINTGYYFGDTVDDMKAASAADFTPIGVIPPGHSRKKMSRILVNKGAEKILEDINDIEEILQ